MNEVNSRMTNAKFLCFAVEYTETEENIIQVKKWKKKRDWLAETC